MRHVPRRKERGCYPPQIISASTNNQGNTSAGPSFSPTVRMYSQALFCRRPTSMVSSHGGSASFERFAKVRLFHLLWVAFTNTRLGATALYMRDQRHAKGHEDSYACRKAIISKFYFKFFVVRAQRVVLDKLFPDTTVRRVPVRLRDKVRAEVSLS